MSCRLKSRQPYNREAQETVCVITEDRSNDAWIAEAWEAGVGSIRTDPGTSPLIEPGEGVKGEDLTRTDCELGSVGAEHQ